MAGAGIILHANWREADDSAFRHVTAQGMFMTHTAQLAPFKGKRVFITGADGFIRSHLTEACVQAGTRVTALSCYSSFDADGWLNDLPADVTAELEIVRRYRI